MYSLVNIETRFLPNYFSMDNIIRVAMEAMTNAIFSIKTTILKGIIIFLNNVTHSPLMKRTLVGKLPVIRLSQ